MATSFAQAPQPLHSPTYIYQQQQQQPYYNHNSARSTPPSNNVSPTNHHSHLHARQMRQPKQPLYIPAVLRPTELPCSRQTSLTPPRSAHSSLDSTRDPAKFAGVSSLPVSPASEDDRAFAPWGQGSISRVVTDEWNDEPLGSVTGAPTRNHWKEARFHPQGTFQRSCDLCYSDYRTWRKTRNSRNNSVTSKGSEETATAQPVGVPGQNGNGDAAQQPVGSIAQSVGGAWNWSTF
ncbi:hypothetical protein MBLNU459_g0438t1 [Dothideomycetes sp. NU459]